MTDVSTSRYAARFPPSGHEHTVSSLGVSVAKVCLATPKIIGDRPHADEFKPAHTKSPVQLPHMLHGSLTNKMLRSFVTERLTYTVLVCFHTPRTTETESNTSLGPRPRQGIDGYPTKLLS